MMESIYRDVRHDIYTAFAERTFPPTTSQVAEDFIITASYAEFMLPSANHSGMV